MTLHCALSNQISMQDRLANKQVAYYHYLLLLDLKKHCEIIFLSQAKPFQPGKWDKICGAHFLYGKPSRNPAHCDFIPWLKPLKGINQLKRSIKMGRRNFKNDKGTDELPWDTPDFRELGYLGF